MAVLIIIYTFRYWWNLYLAVSMYSARMIVTWNLPHICDYFHSITILVITVDDIGRYSWKYFDKQAVCGVNGHCCMVQDNTLWSCWIFSTNAYRYRVLRNVYRAKSDPQACLLLNIVCIQSLIPTSLMHLTSKICKMVTFIMHRNCSFDGGDGHIYRRCSTCSTIAMAYLCYELICYCIMKMYLHSHRFMTW